MDVRVIKKNSSGENIGNLYKFNLNLIKIGLSYKL